jgi:hypothetical protein
VLSTGNSIGTPALLPDGSISRESVLSGTRSTHEGPSGFEEPRQRRQLGDDRMDEAGEVRP